MASVSFNARERRLVLEGPCWPGDERGIAEAIDAFADPSHLLVLDLTRLTSPPAEVTAAVTASCRTAEQRGCRIHVWPASTLLPTG